MTSPSRLRTTRASVTCAGSKSSKRVRGPVAQRASRRLGFSCHLVRWAVRVLGHLEVIVTRQHPDAARRLEVARESLPMLFLACGGHLGDLESRWFSAEALSAARDRLMLIVQRDAASYDRHPVPLPAWYTSQAIQARLAASCDLPHLDVSAAILILRKLV